MYLDYAATTPLKPKVKEYIISLLDNFYNPSSLYTNGQTTKEFVQWARCSVADFIHSNPDNIIFTSGGSASNTLAIKGWYEKNGGEILYSPISHKSVLKCAESIPDSISLKVDKEGFIDIEDLTEKLRENDKKKLVVIDYANSEIGTIQDVKTLVDVAHQNNALIYFDCTGSISQIPVNVKKLNVDMIGFSAHKLGALKGCGVLYKKENIDLTPLIFGAQEQGLFGGTENMLGIGSLGEAVWHYDYSSITSANRDYVLEFCEKNIPDCYLVGSKDQRLPHNLYICFKGVEGESLMILLDMKDVQIATGSACNSRSLTPSTTLLAIELPKEDLHSCVRITFSGEETQEELDEFCKKLKYSVEALRKVSGWSR